MKAKVFSYKNLIGTTDLKLGDENMGCVYGEFLPTDFYFKEIQSYVYEFWSTQNPDYKKWNSLRINVQLENGYFLYPEGGYTFDNLPEFKNEPIRIDIAGIDRHVIEDYFISDPPRPFVEEPWSLITVDQKIAYENELYKELGSNIKDTLLSRVFNTVNSKHELKDYEFSALCQDQRSDDVLFILARPNYIVEQRFVIVHLTWKGKKENGEYPTVTFFKDFDEFKYLKMYPDKIDWED